MPAAAAVADEVLEYRVGDRWFGCVTHVDPDLLIGTMRRAQAAPTDQHDPRLTDWLTAVFTFLMVATDPADHDGLVRIVTERGPDVVDDIAEAFAGVLAAFTERQLGETRLRIIQNERARAVALTPTVPPPVRRRSTVEDVERILASHGGKTTGSVIRTQ